MSWGCEGSQGVKTEIAQTHVSVAGPQADGGDEGKSESKCRDKFPLCCLKMTNLCLTQTQLRAKREARVKSHRPRVPNNLKNAHYHCKSSKKQS